MSDHTAGLHAVSRELFIRGMRQVASSVAVVTTNGSGGSAWRNGERLLVRLGRPAAASRLPPVGKPHRRGGRCQWLLLPQHPLAPAPACGRALLGHSRQRGDDRFEGIDIDQEGEEWVVLEGFDGIRLHDLGPPRLQHPHHLPRRTCSAYRLRTTTPSPICRAAIGASRNNDARHRADLPLLPRGTPGCVSRRA